MAEGIGTDKWCPFKYLVHCLDICEWNDGEGCAIWRIVKALEEIKKSVNAVWVDMPK